jgi:transposase
MIAEMVSRPSTPEYPPESNSMISSPGSESSRPSTTTTSSSVTVPLVSISSARACFRFFNSLLKGVYDSCVLPTETAFAASHSICSSMYSSSTAPRSTWRQVTFHPPPSLNLQRTFSLSSPFSALVSTVPAAQGGEENPPPKKGKKRSRQEEEQKPPEPEDEQRLIRACHIRARLTTQQREQVIFAIAVQRASFNFAVEMVTKYKAMPYADKLRDAWFGFKQEVRSNSFGDSHLYRYIVNAKTHTKIDAQGIRQFMHAYNSGREKAKAEGKNPSSAPLPRFRSARKLLRETLNLEKVSTGGPLLRFLPVPYVERKQHGLCLVKIGGDQFTKAEDKGLKYFLLEDKVDIIERLVSEGTPRFDGKLTWDKRIGAFHFIYTYELPRLPDPDPAFQTKRIVATDPGVYPFQAWYSPTSGEHGRLLEGETDKLISRCHAIDKLQSRVDRYRGGLFRRRRQRWRTRKRLKKRLARERVRLTNWVKGAHYDCAHQLLKKHDLILQPTLETARLSRRASRRIQSSTVRKMMTWSHYRFVQRLESASARYAGRHVIKCKEPGTSKTCTNCGFWKANLRVSDKRFACPRCNVVVDRQLAGARNNFFAAYGAAVGVKWDGVDG